MGLVSYFAGIATGWLVRGTVDGSRGLAVNAVATAYAVAERTKRWGAIEREYVEDLLAEAKARYERSKVRRDEAAAGDTARAPASRGFVQ